MPTRLITPSQLSLFSISPVIGAWWEELQAQKLFEGSKPAVSELDQQPVLPFNSSAAQWFAALVSHREGIGRPISTADAVIAATALAHDGHLATRNTADFDAIGLRLINPWDLDGIHT